MIEELIAAERLGIEAKKFIESDIGRYLFGCAKQDEDNAKEELLNIDPYKFNSLSDLQNKISEIQRNVRIYREMGGYISAAITDSEQASINLDSGAE